MNFNSSRPKGPTPDQGSSSRTQHTQEGQLTSPLPGVALKSPQALPGGTDAAQRMPGEYPLNPEGPNLHLPVASDDGHSMHRRNDAGGGGAWLRMPNLSKASPALANFVDKTLGAGKQSKLLKQTTGWAGPLVSKVKSTISEPKDMAGKAADVRQHVADGERAKVRPALSEAEASRRQNSPAAQALSTTHCQALTTRLTRATAVLAALGTNGTTREQLHELTTSKLKPTTFPDSAAMVKRLSAAYQDRQVTGVHKSAEAHVEQGIKTLNLMHEARELHTAVAPAAPAIAGPSSKVAAAPTPLDTAAGRLDTAHGGAITQLGNFRAAYTSFLKDELGCRDVDVAGMRADIERVVNVNSSPAVRNAAHANVMARAVAGQRIEKGLRAVTDDTARTALRDRIDTLRADPNLQHGDREILEFVHELSDPRQPESSREFLRGIQELKGAPLDQTLRVHKDIYRKAFQPERDPNEPAALADWKETRAKDMEKVNAELTSIALHVAQANQLGTLDTQLAAAFPQAAGMPVPAERAQIKQNFEDSCTALVNRQPGQEVTAQDKLNVKLAKCILDNGAGIRDIAGQLQYLQESYANDLDRSPDMKKLLAGGSTGASYDPVEQRANARARLQNLQMGILDYSRTAGETYQPPADVTAEVIDQSIERAQRIVDLPRADMTPAAQDKAAALERHLFLMKNYVRESNSGQSRELLTQLGDNDPRCGTDAVVAENVTLYGNGGISFGAKHKSGISAYGGLDGAVAAQRPAPAMLQRNYVPNSIVLTESTAYSIKSICKLETTSNKGTLKAGAAFSYGSAQEGRVVKSALSFGGGEGVGYERVEISNPEPGLACMVHKAPVLDGTSKNEKISNGTYIGMNDAVNRALFDTVRVDGVTPVASGMPGWDNVNRFLAATDRATLEPLQTKREVTVTLSHQHAEQVGGSFSGSVPDKGVTQGVFGGRVGVGFDAKYSHAYREELIQTPTLNKLTTSDAFSQNRTVTAGPAALRISGSTSMDGGATYAAILAADAALKLAQATIPLEQSTIDHLTEVKKVAHDANSSVPKVRYGTQIELGRASRGVETARDYKEDYKRVVRDQFGNEIPSLVRDSRQATDGRLLVNNLVNEVGLLNATMSQRVDSANMSAVEKQTVTKLLCLATIASHYRNAGELDSRANPPNDNLTINVTASLSPAAAARHAAVKGRFGRDPAEGEADAILDNSLNYQTLGAAGGFKNQNSTARTNILVARTKRSTSSAQSAGYPSGVDVISEPEARLFNRFLSEDRNADVREALQSVGMGEPLKLLADYEQLLHPGQPRIDAIPEEPLVEWPGDSGRALPRDLETGLASGQVMEMTTPRT